MPSYALNIDHVLTSGTPADDEIRTTGYFYGITGGNTYLDASTAGAVNHIDEHLNTVYPGDLSHSGLSVPENATYADVLEAMVKSFEDMYILPSGTTDKVTSLLPIVGQVNSFIENRTESGTENIKVSGDTELVLHAVADNEEEGEGDKVRYYGAFGGDVVANANIGYTVPSSGDSLTLLGLVLGDSMPANTPAVDVTREGSSKVIIDSGSALLGSAGSAAIAVGNISGEVDVLGSTANMTTGGTASATITGSVSTTINKDANVIGWANGGMAMGLGSTASTKVEQGSSISIYGVGVGGAKDATLNAKDEDFLQDDLIPQATNILDAMKGSGMNAIGVTGGGAAVTTLGGTATAEVVGDTHIDVDDSTVIGVIGGGAAASVDATGVVEALNLGTTDQVGNNEGKSDLELSLGDVANVTVSVDQSIEGGEATATTGNTNINLTGSTTAIGVVGGGVAVASHTYQEKNADGTSSNQAYKDSIAIANTGKSTITVNTDDMDVSGSGWGTIGQAVGSVVNLGQNISEPGTGASTDLTGLDNKGAALGIFGGGVAFGHGSLVTELPTKGTGATATVNTAGSDIQLVSGYAAAVFGGGAAVTDNLARAEANMTDDVNITTYSGMTTVGIFGGGLALSMEGSTDGERAVAEETLAKSNVGTVNITNYGNTDGIFGGGMAIGNSLRNGGNDEYNDAVSSVKTSNITVNDGTVDNLNMDAFMGALKNGNADGDKYPQWSVLGVNASGAMVDLKGIMVNTSIAAGGLGMGMTGEARVDEANVTINGGTITKDILGGGIGIDNYGEKGGAHVGESNITLNGGEVDGSVYAGGAVNGSTPGQVEDIYGNSEKPIGYDASGTSSTVGNATVTLNGTSVTGEISGQGYSKTTQYTVKDDGKDFDPYNTGSKVTYSDKTLYDSVTGTSTLNLIGNNTLTMLGTAGEGDNYTSASKIHDFDTINFQAGSVTKVEGLTTDSAALIDASNGIVSVDASAKLDVTALTAEDNASYKIVANANAESTYWKDSSLIYDRTAGYMATGDSGEDNTKYDVTYTTINSMDEAQKEEAANSMGEALSSVFQPTIDDAFDKNWDTSRGLTEGGKQFFSDWSKDGTGAAYGRAAMIGEDAAVTGNTVSIARDMADNVMQRLSFTDDYVQDAGWVNNDGGIWAKYIHRKYETDNMGSSFGGIHSSTDYDGAIVGVDFAKHGNFQSGVAFHYGSGDGNGLISRNDYDAWGFTLYGSLKDEEAGTNLMADVGYVTSDNDIDGTVNGKSLSADRDVDAWTIGLRGEKEYVFGQNQLVPYVGLRYMSVNPARYSVYYDGAKAFNADADNQNLWLLPIGVSFRNETVTDGGWRITPKLDLSYIWAFGDTDTDMTLDMGGVGSGLYYDVMDDNSWLASLGVEATKDVWSFGVGYGYQKGDDTKNKTWFVNASYAF